MRRWAATRSSRRRLRESDTQRRHREMKHRPLVALSSAAVLAVYAAGYVRTRAAADRFAAEAVPRRAPAATPPLVQPPPPLPSVQPGEPVIAPLTERIQTRA